MPDIKIGIVGAGSNTQIMHLPKFKAIPGVKVHSVCNRSLASSQKVADQFDIPKVFEHWEELVEDDQIDAVCIGTWPYMHHPITLKALKAGKHVLTEARMAMNLQEAEEMLACSKEHPNLVTMIVPAPLWLESEPTLIQMVNEGYFGKILEIQVCSMSGTYNPDASAAWRQREDFSGQNIMSLGIFNETLRRYFGNESSVFASAKCFTTERVDAGTGNKVATKVPETLTVVAEYGNDFDATYRLSSIASNQLGSLIEVYGSKASFRLDKNGASITEGTASVWEALKIDEEKKGGWRVEQDFIDAIRDQRPVTHTSFEDGVSYMKFTDGIHQSLQLKNSIVLNW